MVRKDIYKIVSSFRGALSVGDEPGHYLVLTEVEGEPIQYDKEMAGEFVSRRSVAVHDRIRGAGWMIGYVVENFQQGSVFSRFEAQRDPATKNISGSWKAYKGTGKLSTIKGQGSFIIKRGDQKWEFLLEISGEYELE